MEAHETPAEPGADDRSTVLEVFGVKLSVKNRRLAEILTMDAAEALGFESRSARSAGGSDATREVVTEAIPDLVLSTPDPQDKADARLRTELRHEIDDIGAALGFTIASGGAWRSPLGLRLHTRIVSRPISAAAAADMVGKLVALIHDRSSQAESILLVTRSRDVGAALTHAIGERGVHGLFRVASVGDLQRLQALAEAREGDHAAVAAILAPQAAVDVGASIALATGRADTVHDGYLDT